MSAATCPEPIGFDALLDYWLGDLDDERTGAVDLHLLGCERCGAQLDELIALGDGVRGAFDEGRVGTIVGARFAQRLAELGLRVREYRVERNGSVNCRIAPDDDVVIGRLSAPLAGIARLDLVRRGGAGSPELRAVDIPFDAASGEVVMLSSALRLRELPTCVEQVQLVAVDAAGERLVGDYWFNHRAGRD